MGAADEDHTVMQLRERMVRLETLLEQLATAGAKHDEQLQSLWKAVRTTDGSVGTLKSLVERDHAVRQAEAARDRRTMRAAIAALSALWIVTQAVQLLVTWGS